jgi:hypothetical protein
MARVDCPAIPAAALRGRAMWAPMDRLRTGQHSTACSTREHARSPRVYFFSNLFGGKLSGRTRQVVPAALRGLLGHDKITVGDGQCRLSGETSATRTGGDPVCDVLWSDA